MELLPLGIHVTMIDPGDFKTGFTDSRVFARQSSTNLTYQDSCKRAVAVMEHDEQNGAAPIQLARMLATIIGTRSPRLRYAVGMRAQRLAVGLRRVLPDSLVEKALMAYYKTGQR